MFANKGKILMTGTFCAMALALGGAEANAQGQQQGYSAPPPQSIQQQQEIGTEKLQQFIKAESAARDIQEKFQKQVANISSKEKMANLQRQANEQMVQAIEETGMSIGQYSQVLTAIQSSPQLQEKYKSMVQ